MLKKVFEVQSSSLINSIIMVKDAEMRISFQLLHLHVYNRSRLPYSVLFQLYEWIILKPFMTMENGTNKLLLKTRGKNLNLSSS